LAHLHGLSVAYRQHIVKGVFKDFSGFLPGHFLGFAGGSGSFLAAPCKADPPALGGRGKIWTKPGKSDKL
jgi:hypothetical protein